MVRKAIYFTSFIHTYWCDTGLFIFNTKTNTFNTEDFTLNPLYTKNEEDDNENYIFEYINQFKNLHEKDILDYCVDEDKIIINLNDRVCEYYPLTDELIEILGTETDYIKIAKDKVYCRKNSTIHIVDIESKETKTVQVGDVDKMVRYWDIFDNQLVIITHTYENPYGQIYKKNHDAECRKRNMKIKFLLL